MTLYRNMKFKLLKGLSMTNAAPQNYTLHPKRNFIT